jgi:hypothetical protein
MVCRTWTEEELDRVAADLVDEAIIAAGGDLKRAERVLRRCRYLRTYPCICTTGFLCGLDRSGCPGHARGYAAD